MRCIYADSDNSNKFNQGDSGVLAQMYLQLSKSGEIIFDIKREIYPKVAGYLATKGRLITIDLSRGLGNQYKGSEYEWKKRRDKPVRCRE